MAARLLNRAQSAVSYSIANIEEQLDLKLFSHLITKRQLLILAERAVLEDARRLVSDLNLLRARAKNMNQGLEGEGSVAISSIVPSDVIVEALHRFRNHMPTVSLNLTVGTLGTVIDAVSSGKAIVGFGGFMSSSPDHIALDRVGHTVLLPVAAPSHRLALQARPLEPIDVRDETQITVYDSSCLKHGRNFNVFSLRTWRVSDNATTHLLVRGGLGWGGLPLCVVQDDIACQRLLALPFPAFSQLDHPIYKITKTSRKVRRPAVYRWKCAPDLQSTGAPPNIKCAVSCI